MSLIKVGPARVKIRARDISKIKGFLEIFVEGVDHCIKFDHELPKKKAPAENPQTQNKNQEEGEGYDDEEEDDLHDFDGDPTKKKQGAEEGASPARSQSGLGQYGRK